MSPAELHAYFVRIRLPEAGRRLVETARRESPVRQVQSRLGNVLTRFPSRKMQRVITAESRTVEFPALIQYEHDASVLEYYAQPVMLDLRITDGDATKPSRLQHTPDFLLLREEGVCIEEWREEARIEKLAIKYPGRFVKNGRRWSYPKVEAHLHGLGIQYRLRTATEHPEILVQNLLFLADYYAPDVEPLSAGVLAAIHVRLREHGAVPLAELVTSENRAICSSMRDVADVTTRQAAGSRTDECCPSFTADDVYQAIAQGLVTYDLWNEPLSDIERSKIYRDEPALQFTRRLEVPAGVPDSNRIASIQPGHVVSYDGRSYTVTLAGRDRVTLAGDEGSTELAISTLQTLYEKGQIEITAGNTTRVESAPSPLSTLSPDEVARAVKRGLALDLSLQDVTATGIASRTLRRWRSLVRAAGADLVSRNLALVDKVRSRGNRTRKLPEPVLSLIERIAAEVYNHPTSVNVSSAYRSFVSACHASGLQPCSYRSFSLELQTRESIRKREGKRSAYQSAPIVWYLNAKDPIHGVRPFEYVHIDHTPLDILLVSGETKQLLGRPWLSLAIDAESRAIVGFYLSFEGPSFRSCMMVLRDIVRRHGRLPSTLVTDNGAEFRSGAFQRVCELYSVTLRYRPAGHPRHGCVMERVFGTTQSQLIHNLAGNTKQLKSVRMVTKSVAPHRYAQWTLPALYGALNKYFHDIYGTERHPAHGEAPELHLRTRLVETGLRRHRLVRLDRRFLIETCPPVDQSGERRVDSQRGVKVHYLWYWTEAFRRPRVDGTSRPVRVDPWDARFCYVLLGHDWHQCVCKLTTMLRRLTRLELESYFEEMTQKRGVKKHELTPERVREWMQVLDKDVFDERLQARQAEARLIYDALGLTSTEITASMPAAGSTDIDNHELELHEISDASSTCTQRDTDTTDAEENEYALY